MNKKLLAAAAAGLLGAVAIAGTAAADPSGSPTYRALSGVGSDTTQNVVNALSDAVTIGSVKQIGSYNATGSSTIQTKSTSNCVINRPDGSGAGRTALAKSLVSNDPTFGCLDFARSSSLDLSSTPNSLTYIPFAVDGLSYAITSGSGIPRQLGLQDIKDIYNCASPDINPLIPQANSGTRKFFLQTIGLTEAQVSASPCIKDSRGGQVFQENDGRRLTNNDIFPFSVAAFAAQTTGVSTDLRGTIVLGSIDGVSPVALNGDFGVKRDVYNVVPTARTGTAPTSTVFVGPNSLVCQATGVIRTYGFATNPNCGSTSNVTAP